MVTSADEIKYKFYPVDEVYWWRLYKEGEDLFLSQKEYTNPYQDYTFEYTVFEYGYLNAIYTNFIKSIQE